MTPLRKVGFAEQACQAVQSPKEAELIRRCRHGEARAWNELFDLHYDAVGRFIFQVGSDLHREDVEELCQEVFLTVVRNLSTFRGASALQTWLFRIAANKTRDFRERQQAAKRGGGHAPLSLQAEDPETGLTPDVPAAGATPDAALVQTEEGELLRAALERLGDPCRQIIELRYFGELSYEELATALSLNPKTVSSRLSKCLDRLEQVARQAWAGGNPTGFPV